MSHGKILLFGVGVAALIFVGVSVWNRIAPGKYDAFAQCLGEKGATFYGAFWCPHCQEQKKLFGRSADELPYVECSTPGGQDQLPVCAEAGVKNYPTWVFAAGERLSGLIPLETLAEKTGCALPL